MGRYDLTQGIHIRSTPLDSHRGIMLGSEATIVSSAKKHKRATARKTPVSGAGTVASRKVAIDFPEPLFEETERATAELSINRSTLIRSAVAQYLEARRRAKLVEELAAGYKANAELDRKIAAEFSAVDYESF